MTADYWATPEASPQHIAEPGFPGSNAPGWLCIKPGLAAVRKDGNDRPVSVPKKGPDANREMAGRVPATQAARELNISPTIIQRACRLGRISFIRRTKYTYVSLSEVRDYLTRPRARRAS